MPSKGKILIAIAVITTVSLSGLSFLVPYLSVLPPVVRTLLCVIIGLIISGVLAAAVSSLMKGLPDRIRADDKI